MVVCHRIRVEIQSKLKFPDADMETKHPVMVRMDMGIIGRGHPSQMVVDSRLIYLGEKH